MSDNTVPLALSGFNVLTSHHNSIVTALKDDLVPRGEKLSPQDLAGSLGTENFRWLQGFIQELIVGTVGNNISIKEDSNGDIRISQDSVFGTELVISDNSLEVILADGTTVLAIDNSGVTTPPLKVNSDANLSRRVVAGNTFLSPLMVTWTLKAGQQVLISFGGKIYNNTDIYIRLYANGAQEESRFYKLTGPQRVSNVLSEDFIYEAPLDGDYTILLSFEGVSGSVSFYEKQSSYLFEEL